MAENPTTKNQKSLRTLFIVLRSSFIILLIFFSVAFAAIKSANWAQKFLLPTYSLYDPIAGEFLAQTELFFFGTILIIIGLTWCHTKDCKGWFMSLFYAGFWSIMSIAPISIIFDTAAMDRELKEFIASKQVMAEGFKPEVTPYGNFIKMPGNKEGFFLSPEGAKNLLKYQEPKR